MSWLAPYNPLFVALIAAATAPALHLIDKLLDQINLLGSNYVRSKLRASPKPDLSRIAENEPLFVQVEAYFRFERDVHFIVASTLFALFSLVVSHFETAKDLGKVSAVTVAAVFAWLGFVILFLRAVLVERVDPKRAGATRRWVRTVLALFALTLAAEIYLEVAKFRAEADERRVAAPP